MSLGRTAEIRQVLCSRVLRGPGIVILRAGPKDVVRGVQTIRVFRSEVCVYSSEDGELFIFSVSNEFLHEVKSENGNENRCVRLSSFSVGERERRVCL